MQQTSMQTHATHQHANTCNTPACKLSTNIPDGDAHDVVGKSLHAILFEIGYLSTVDFICMREELLLDHSPQQLRFNSLVLKLKMHKNEPRKHSTSVSKYATKSTTPSLTLV